MLTAMGVAAVLLGGALATDEFRYLPEAPTVWKQGVWTVKGSLFGREFDTGGPYDVAKAEPKYLDNADAWLRTVLAKAFLPSDTRANWRAWRPDKLGDQLMLWYEKTGEAKLAVVDEGFTSIWIVPASGELAADDQDKSHYEAYAKAKLLQFTAFPKDRAPELKFDSRDEARQCEGGGLLVDGWLLAGADERAENANSGEDCWARIYFMTDGRAVRLSIGQRKAGDPIATAASGDGHVRRIGP